MALSSFHPPPQKKVNPELPVEIKPSNRARKLQENKLKKQKQKAVLKRQRDDEQRWHIEMRSNGISVCVLKCLIGL